MDAVEFFRERKRMCHSLKCGECPLYNNGCISIPSDTEGFVATVEKWSKEHPIVRNWQKFQEVFGTAINPVTATVDWWSKEYKAPKGKQK